MKSLRYSDLAFVIYYSNENEDVTVTLSLFSNNTKKENIKQMIEWSPYFEPEFFSISFQLEFDCNSVTISPDRIVNKKFQRNRICSSISLAALKKYTNT